MIFRPTLLLSAICLFFCGLLPAQLPLVQGTSQAQSGMLYYNFHEANDLRPRTYLYTLCPPEATCLRLDFTMLESGMAQDFIRVFDGPGRDAQQIASLGGVSGSQLLQGSSGCLTFEFTRADAGLRTAWTAHWQSQSKGDCIDPSLDGACADVQDICGPEYRENRPFLRPQATAKLEAGADTKEFPARWYRFVAARDGDLRFTLLPDNRFDDFDWRLVAADSEDECPVGQNGLVPLAHNFAAGRGALAATGMGEFGNRRLETQAGNPFSAEIQVQKGRSYFLQVQSPAQNAGGFRLLLNDVVLACDNPVGELLRVAHKPPKHRSPVPARDAYSRNTQVLRLSLDEKANQCLLDCQATSAMFAALPAPDGRSSIAESGFATTQGIAQALIMGLKTGRFPAYSADNFAAPLHYGDLLALSYRFNPTDQETSFDPEDSIFGMPTHDYWSPDPAQFVGFENLIELVVDQVFDKQSGRKKSHIRFIRLIWTDWEGQMPDYNVAIFHYRDVAPLFKQIKLSNGHNDVDQRNLEDFLIGQQFSYLMTWKSGKSVTSPAQGKYLQIRTQQLEDYKWGN